MFDKHTGQIDINPNTITWSEVYSKAIVELMSENQDIVTIVPATGVGSSLENAFELFPKRCFDVGIAEEHALTMAGGLAANGKHPIVSIYSTFLQRAFDELSHDIARMNLNATLLIDRSGLVGEDGNTHQGIYDESFLLSTPNTVVTMASRESEAYGLVKESLNNRGLFCIRFPRSRVVASGQKEETPFKKWKKELDGTKTAIVSVGPITIDLKEQLQKLNKGIALYNALYLKPMDEELINSEIVKYNKVIIYDAYGIESGFAQQLATYLLVNNSFKGEVIIKSIPDVFVEHASQQEQLSQFGLLPEQIIELL